MKKPTPEIVDLTERERDWLLEVYELRRESLLYKGCFRCYVGCVVYLTMFYFISAFYHDLFSDGSRWLSRNFLSAVSAILWISAPLSILISFIAYRTRILSFRQDALSGKKFRKLFVITKKEFFPITGQYFVKINDGFDKRYEVDEKTFSACEEGGPIYFGQAILSGYIFRQSNSIDVKMFNIGRGSQFDYKV